MVTIYLKGTRKYGKKSYENETYLIAELKGGVVCTENGVIITLSDMKLSKILQSMI